MKRDKKIEIRVSMTELMQIRKYFEKSNITISQYIREHLLEMSEGNSLNLNDKGDIYRLFKEFINDDEVCAAMFTKYLDKNGLTKDYYYYEEPIVNVGGKLMTYSECIRLEEEERLKGSIGRQKSRING